MGEVYLGFDKRLERRVAVKTIRPERRPSARAKARFLREARILSKLGHPAICQVYDLLETPTADFLILEYVEGKTVRQLAEEGSLTPSGKLALAEKIAAALAVAHRERIVHRDLKADNVMVTPAGEVKVLDFGIARSLGEGAETGEPEEIPEPEENEDAPFDLKELDVTLDLKSDHPALPSPTPAAELTLLTRQGRLVGTIHAMSPEQAAGGRVTEASDLYSFGVLLQELFSGEPAYQGTTPGDILPQVLRGETRPRRGLDPDLSALLGELLALDPYARPSALQTGRRLREIAEKPQRRRRLRIRTAVLAGAFAVLLAGLATVSYFALEAERARREAERRRGQAEGLIRFLLSDLRPKLEAMGRLEILEAMGDQALAYFAAVPEEQLTGEELLGRVKALRQIGEVRRDQGHLPPAATAMRRAVELSRELVEREPQSEAARHELVESLSWLGQIAWDQGQVGPALALWQETLALAREQLARHPASPLWEDTAANAYHNVGTALERQGDLDGALAAYEQALVSKRRWAAARPDDTEIQGQLGATLAFVSHSLEKRGNLAGALAKRQDYLEIQERLSAADPGNLALQQELATARGFVAGLLVILGRRQEARELLGAGLATVERLAEEDPENMELERWRGAFLSSLGWLATEEDQMEEARRLLSQACQVFERLTTRDPTNSDWQLQKGGSRARRAEALEPLDPAAAARDAEASLEILAPLLTPEADEAVRGYAAGAWLTLSRLAGKAGREKERRAACEKALEIVTKLKDPAPSWRLLEPKAEALRCLGREGEARATEAALRGMGYVGP